MGLRTVGKCHNLFRTKTTKPEATNPRRNCSKSRSDGPRGQCYLRLKGLRRKHCLSVEGALSPMELSRRNLIIFSVFWRPGELRTISSKCLMVHVGDSFVVFFLSPFSQSSHSHKDMYVSVFFFFRISGMSFKFVNVFCTFRCS